MNTKLIASQTYEFYRDTESESKEVYTEWLKHYTSYGYIEYPFPAVLCERVLDTEFTQVLEQSTYRIERLHSKGKTIIERVAVLNCKDNTFRSSAYCTRIFIYDFISTADNAK